MNLHRFHTQGLSVSFHLSLNEPTPLTTCPHPHAHQPQGLEVEKDGEEKHTDIDRHCSGHFFKCYFQTN